MRRTSPCVRGTGTCRDNTFVAHQILNVGVEDVQPALLLLDKTPVVARAHEEILVAEDAGPVLGNPLRVVLMRTEQSDEHTVCGSLRHGVGDLTQVHEVMATTHLRGVKSMLDDESKTAADEAIGTSLALGSDVAWYGLVRLQVKEGLVESEDLPLDGKIVGLDPGKELHVKISLSGDHVVQDVLKILILAQQGVGQVVGFVGETVLRHKLRLEIVKLAKVGFESVLLGDLILNGCHGIYVHLLPPIYTHPTFMD